MGYLKKCGYQFLIYHIRELFKVEQISEVRFTRAIWYGHLNAIKKNIALKLIFTFDNELLEYKTNGITESTIFFYIVTTNISIYLIGISSVYHDNGTKEEKLICVEKISKITKWLLSNKYNTILYP